MIDVTSSGGNHFFSHNALFMARRAIPMIAFSRVRTIYIILYVIVIKWAYGL